MRVATFNILLGGEERMEAIVEVVRRADPDLLVLQECLGWEDGARLRDVARAMSAIHAFLGEARPRGSGRRYHVAVLSRRPMEVVRVHDDPARLGHCVVEAEVEGIQVLGTHFDSHAEDLRLREAVYVSDVADLSRPALLVGDLNALSRRDAYPGDLADLLRRAGVDKYGHPPRFDAIDALERAGWIDARPGGEWVTARRDRGGVPIEYRTDYIFCSPPLARRLVSARVVPAEGASDHDLVVAELEDRDDRSPLSRRE